MVRLNMGAVEMIALSPSGDGLVAAGATHICMYNTADFEMSWCAPASLPAELEKWGGLKRNYEKFVRTIVFRQDGSQIAYALWYGAIVFLDSTTGQRLDVIDGNPQDRINELVWSQDNTHLIVWSSENGVDTWNIETGQKDGHLEIDPTQIQSAAWTPDGNSAAIRLNESGVISLWDMITLTQTSLIDTKLPEFGYKLALSPDGTMVYASVFTLMGNCGADQGDQGWIKAWEIATGELIFDTDMAGACMQRMFVSPDGYWLAGITGYGKLKVLGTASGWIEFDPPYNFFKSLAWLGEDRFLFVHYPANPYGSADLKSIGALDMDTKWISPIYLTGFETIYSLAWLPGGEGLVTNSAGGTISIWEAATGQRREQFQITLEGISLTNFGSTSISPLDGTLATPALKSVATIDLGKRQVLKVMDYESPRAGTHAAYSHWSADGKRVAALVFDLVTNAVVWDAATGKVIFTLPIERPISTDDLALSPDGTKLAISEFPGGEFLLLIWDIEVNKEIVSIKTPDSANALTWINQTQLAVSSHGWIDIYDSITGNKLRTVGEGGYTYAISPDLSLVAAENDWGTLTLTDFTSGKELAHFSLEPVMITSLAISPDGKLLAGLTEYGSVIIWDISPYYK